MKYLPLLWAGLWRKPLRTLLSIAVAFVLFGILSGIDAGFAHTLADSRFFFLRPEITATKAQIAAMRSAARVPVAVALRTR